ncbi:MAG: DUF669 domain-containing protein [Phycisphaerales bacterium]|nr:MAG: DUF669 domain-containing protein [Phycisphaerales bacterium]
MANLNGFDANEVEPAVGFDPIPVGRYLAVITDSEMKPTKSGTGSFLELTFQVLEGEFKERLLWTRLNLDNPNATTVRIARAELSAICRAVGVMTPKDSIDLHNVPLAITVGQRKRQDTGEMTNVIKDYAKKDAAAPKPTTSGNDGKAPWKK